MGFIEEGRQLFQDFVAPEIRAIDVRLSAVEKKIEALDAKVDRNHTELGTKIDALDAKIERTDAKLEARIERAEAKLEARMDRNHAEVMDTLRRMEQYSLLAERPARLEGKLQNVA